MPVNTPYNIARLTLIAAFSIGGLVACNSNTDSQADKEAAADSLRNVTDNAAKDSAAAKTAKVTKKKGRGTLNLSSDNTADASAASKEKMMKDKDGIYNRAEVMPEFPGGNNALANYVNNHLEYPQQAIDNNKEGTVKVSFVVDENGKVSKANIMDGSKLGNGLDEEALKVFNNMPVWKPGKVHGKNVKTRLELPIAFKLEEA
ncbi:energy transducer TonB [Flavitalea flava]